MSSNEIDKIAQTVHEALRGWIKANGQPSLPDWDNAEDWMKQSTRESVEFAIQNPAAPSSSQHDQWMDQKVKSGWKHGAKKDEKAKTHPMMVPYDQLPEYEKKKDAIVQALARALATKA